MRAMTEASTFVPPALLGHRSVRLRRFAEADLPVLTDIRNDAELQRQLMVDAPTPHDEAQVRAWLSRRSADPQGAFWVVADADSDACLGFVQLTGIEGDEAFFGICLSRAAQGQGLGALAIELLSRAALREKGVKTLKLQVRADNDRARRLYLRLGFEVVSADLRAFVMAR